jgi:phage gpG-like protein
MSLQVLITDNSALKALDQFFNRSRDLTTPLAAAASALTDLVGLEFSESKGPFGLAWAPLAPATIKRRRQGSSKPLVDTGALQNSFHPSSTASEAVVSSDRTVDGFNLAEIHNFGTRDGRIPPRVIFPQARLPDEWSNEVGDAVRSYLIGLK